MLTGDENIVDIDFDVVWQVNPARAQDFVFNLQNPQGTIKAVAESAMREVIGRRNIQAILTTEQASVAQEVRQIMQQTLDAYGAGVLVNVVQLQAAQPPAEVRQAFFDVNAAQQDAVRVQNEAETFASRVVPEARGEAARDRAAGRRLSRAVDRRRDRSGRALQPGLRGVPQGARRHPRAHLPRDDGARARRHGQDHHRPERQARASCPYLPLNELQRRPPQRRSRSRSRERRDEQLTLSHRRS